MYFLCNYPNFDKEQFLSTISPHIDVMHDFDFNYPKQVKRAIHSHESATEILFILDGGGTVMVDNVTYDVTKNDILVFNQGVLHDDTGSQSTHYAMKISNLQIPGLPQNHLIPSNHSPVIHSGHMADCIKSTLDELFEIRKADKFSERNLVNAILLSLINYIRQLSYINTNTAKKKEDSLPLQIRNYIKDNYDQDLTLDILCNEFHTSKSVLLHIFKEEFSISPIQYLTQLRIGAAQTMLFDTDEPIASIAYAVGYNNLSNFISAFKKRCDMLPSEFRQVMCSRKTVPEEQEQ